MPGLCYLLCPPLCPQPQISQDIVNPGIPFLSGALVPVGDEVISLAGRAPSLGWGKKQSYLLPRGNCRWLEGGPHQGHTPPPWEQPVSSVGISPHTPLEQTSLKAVPDPGLLWDRLRPLTGLPHSPSPSVGLYIPQPHRDAGTPQSLHVAFQFTACFLGQACDRSPERKSG